MVKTMDMKQEPFDIIDEVKQEIIECEESKLEQRSDSDLLQNIRLIKKEPKVTNLYMSSNDIGTKQESCELVQPKTESELLTSLTEHCDLPTLKDESNNNAEIILKSLKDTNSFTHVSKKRKRSRRYPSWSVSQTTSRLPRKKLFNVQFGNCYKACNHCGKVLFNKSHFLSHFTSIHFVKKVTKICKRKFGKYEYCQCKDCLLKSEHQITATITSSHCNKKLFRCDVCSKTFVSEGNLYNHLKNQICKNKCKICSKQFSEKSHLLRHLKIHTGEKPFNCEICFKQFRLKSHLVGHLKIHTGEKPFKCEKCSKQFIRRTDLVRHLKIHTREKLFECQICSKQFSRITDLVRHLKIHTGEKLFSCEICSRQFSRRTCLVGHLKIHTEEKPFKCEKCSKQFSRRAHLVGHLKSHTGEKPFECQICSKQFSEKSNLLRHLKIHTGEKSFNCEICFQQFSQRAHLVGHLKIHTEEKPFNHEICSKQFSQGAHLVEHLKNSHRRKTVQP